MGHSRISSNGRMRDNRTRLAPVYVTQSSVKLSYPYRQMEIPSRTMRKTEFSPYRLTLVQVEVVRVYAPATNQGIPPKHKGINYRKCHLVDKMKQKKLKLQISIILFFLFYRGCKPIPPHSTASQGPITSINTWSRFETLPTCP